jgi:hypothetical protein
MRREPGGPALSVHVKADGSETVTCSFCNQARHQRGVVAGAKAVMCGRCRALASELLERGLEALLHQHAARGECSFCLRPTQPRTASSGIVAVCPPVPIIRETASLGRLV